MNIPSLFSLYFGESAESAERSASRRFRSWARAFEAWYSERERKYHRKTLMHTGLAFRRFAKGCPKMPWEVTSQDIEAHVQWMQEVGLSSSTINCSLVNLRSFYAWCSDHHIDPAFPAGFNPARNVGLITIHNYEGSKIWDRQEVSALLDLLRRYTDPLGRRDYALFLARLNTGVPLNLLLHLRWGQLDFDGGQTCVSWLPGRPAQKLPGEVWQAVQCYLQAGGRLPGMHAEKFVFVPLRNPGLVGTGSQADDWVESKPLSPNTIYASLKIYGRQLGIAEEKLNLIALRTTAIRMKVDEGASTAEMQEFLFTHISLIDIRARLKFLGTLPVEAPGEAFAASGEVDLPDRQAKPYRLGENLVHGLYSRQDRRAAVEQVLAEGIEGMETEVATLRRLMRGLHERDAFSSQAVEVYSESARRLGALLALESTRQADPRDGRAEEMLQLLDRQELDQGRPPVSDQVKREALSGDWQEGGKLCVSEEIATVRLMLRGLSERAASGVSDKEYLNLLDLYSQVCTRLARLVKLGGSRAGRLSRYIDSVVDQAIDAVCEELVKE